MGVPAFDNYSNGEKICSVGSGGRWILFGTLSIARLTTVTEKNIIKGNQNQKSLKKEAKLVMNKKNIKNKLNNTNYTLFFYTKLIYTTIIHSIFLVILN